MLFRSGGSIAVKNPDLFKRWIREYGEDKIILGADVKVNKIAVGGWFETSEHEIDPFIKSYLKEGIKYVICTDISKDGMLKGPAFNLYEKLIVSNPEIGLIASGGISSESELPKLAKIGCEAAIIGKAIYEKKISLRALSEFNKIGRASCRERV
mgnify:FL=1